MAPTTIKYSIGVWATSLLSLALAQCSGGLQPDSEPVAADGYTVQVVANGLTRPRSLQFDSEGNLLVVQQFTGISNIQFTETDGCLEVDSVVDLVSDENMNHGIALSPDGSTMYASTVDTAFAFEYDAAARTATNAQPIVTGMENGGHNTRTLLYTEDGGGTLVAVRGSDGNLDMEAVTKDSGHCHLRAFPLDNVPDGGYEFSSSGTLLGWGLRNSVGLAQHPETGAIWTVENSIDELHRNGEDIHQNNPGEELNHHGTIADSQGLNYGYPVCAAAWNVDEIPDNQALEVGSQFALDVTSDQQDDAFCAEQQAPRLTFAAHTAPLDITFNTSSEAFVSFHGSWNRDIPIGYRVARIEFADGEPVAESTSTEAAVDVVTNADVEACPNGCFRPVGIAFDSQGRLFFASDSTGEIYLVTKA